MSQSWLFSPYCFGCEGIGRTILDTLSILPPLLPYLDSLRLLNPRQNLPNVVDILSRSLPLIYHHMQISNKDATTPLCVYIQRMDVSCCGHHKHSNYHLPCEFFLEGVWEIVFVFFTVNLLVMVQCKLRSISRHSALLLLSFLFPRSLSNTRAWWIFLRIFHVWCSFGSIFWLFPLVLLCELHTIYSHSVDLSLSWSTFRGRSQKIVQNFDTNLTHRKKPLTLFISFYP